MKRARIIGLLGIWCLILASGMASGYLTQWLVPDRKPYHDVAIVAFGFLCYSVGVLHVFVGEIWFKSNKEGEER